MVKRVFRGMIAATLALTSAAVATPSASAAASASVVPSQNQVDYSILRGVDCVTPSDCWAVGSWMHTEARTLIEHWDGSAWQIVPSPNADWANDSHLTGVSCVSSTDCTAVGDASTLSAHDLNAPIDPLFLRWDGSEWTVVPGPRNGPKSFIYDQLEAVDCVASNFCLAVGHRGEAQTLAMRWNGTTWAKVPTPNRTGYNVPESKLSGIACTRRTNCFAVGRSRIEHANGRRQGLTLIEQWDGSRFRIVPSPNVTFRDGQENVLEGVSCPASKTCFATGNFDDPKIFRQRTLVARWNGSAWKVVPSPTPSKQNHSSLSGVSCTSATRCFAAGTEDTSARTVTLAKWDGKAWKLVAAPRIGARQPALRGVACKKSLCFAVGNRDGKTLVVRYR
jgi:hypothetical protein